MSVKRSNSSFITFHDPLAASVIFDENICKFTRGTIDTELESSRSKGILYFNETPNGKNEIAVEVDSNKFFEHFTSV